MWEREKDKEKQSETSVVKLWKREATKAGSILYQKVGTAVECPYAVDLVAPYFSALRRCPPFWGKLGFQLLSQDDLRKDKC